MSFISLLPPSREITFSSMERVLPPGLSTGSTANTSTGPASNPRKTAFLLASLLWLYLYPTATSIPRDAQNSPAESGTWDIWRRMENEVKGRRTLLGLIKKVWGSFAEIDEKRIPGSVEEVLWTEIPLEDNRRGTIRVVDLATAEDAPTWFLSHPLVMISLRTVWSKGIPRPALRESTWVAFDRFSTPKITHAVFLVHHAAYLFNLAYLILAPPSTPIYYLPSRSPSLREWYLFIYSLSAIPLTQAPTLSLLPYVFVTVALALAYPGVPTPNTGPHSILLLSLSFFLLQLHLPNPSYIPSPLYLFDPKRVLPLATLVKGLIKQAVRPGIFFFGPVTLLVGMVLAEALGDSFPLTPNLLASRLYDWLIGPNDMRIFINDGVETTIGPSHPQTRITLLLLFLASIGAMFTLVNCLVMLFPGSVSSKGVLEDRSEYEDYHVESERPQTGDTTPFAINVPASSSTAFAGKNVSEGWRSTGVSTLRDDRGRLAVPTAIGVTGGGPWERYGPSTAISAKRSFAGVLRRYQHLRLISSGGDVDGQAAIIHRPYGRVALPPVFNMIAWIIGGLPAVIVRFISKRSASAQHASFVEDGRTDRISEEVEGDASGLDGHPGERRLRGGQVNKWLEQWEGGVTRLVWRAVVGLPGLIIGGVWFWK